jgi:hypothetical protein
MLRFMLRSSLLALVATPVLLVGCGRDVARNTVAPATDLPSSAINRTADPDHMRGGFGLARVKFVHASPDAPAVDIRVGWRKAAEDLAFPQDTRYLRLLPGWRDIKVNVANTRTTVIAARLKLRPRMNYSVFAVNTVANLEPLVLTDDLTRPAAGKAHVRFIHLSPDAPAVDIAVQGGPVVFPNKSFKDYTPFTPLPAGTYDLEVRLAGTDQVVLPLPGIMLEAGKIYTVFAKGLVGGTGEQALGAQIIVNSVDRNRWEQVADAEGAVEDLR